MTKLLSISIDNFRNIISSQLEVHPKLNFIIGDNGSGKTSFLESLFILGLGKSFRSSLVNKLINHDAEEFTIFATVQSQQTTIPVGIENPKQGKQIIKISGQPQHSRETLINTFPVYALYSEQYRLLQARPALRRKMFDWAMFHVEPSYLSCWRDFNQVLQQRNASIRKKLSFQEVDLWREKFVETSLALYKLRIAIVEDFIRRAELKIQQLIGFKVKINFSPGWPCSPDKLDRLLKENIPSEMRVGYTKYGAHLFDFKVLYEKMLAKDCVSLGQEKLISFAMIVALLELVNEKSSREIILLVDDFKAELGNHFGDALLKQLMAVSGQVFITSLTTEDVPCFVGQERAMFHVEHGRIKAMS